MCVCVCVCVRVRHREVFQMKTSRLKRLKKRRPEAQHASAGPSCPAKAVVQKQKSLQAFLDISLNTAKHLTVCRTAGTSGYSKHHAEQKPRSIWQPLAFALANCIFCASVSVPGQMTLCFLIKTGHLAHTDESAFSNSKNIKRLDRKRSCRERVSVLV